MSTILYHVTSSHYLIIRQCSDKSSCYNSVTLCQVTVHQDCNLQACQLKFEYAAFPGEWKLGTKQGNCLNHSGKFWWDWSLTHLKVWNGKIGVEIIGGCTKQLWEATAKWKSKSSTKSQRSSIANASFGAGILLPVWVNTVMLCKKVNIVVSMDCFLLLTLLNPRTD